MDYTLSSAEESVETFQDVASLISRCKKMKADLLLLDQRLAGTTGNEVTLKFDSLIPKVIIGFIVLY
jgi:FixJ family two-component response regulator